MFIVHSIKWRNKNLSFQTDQKTRDTANGIRIHKEKKMQ